MIDFDRLARAPARDALRPARRRQAPRAARRRLRRHDRRRARSPTNGGEATDAAARPARPRAATRTHGRRIPMTAIDTTALEPLEPGCEWRARRRSATATCSSSPTRTSPSSTPRSVHAESRDRRRARHHPRRLPAADPRARADPAHARAHRRHGRRAHPRRARRRATTRNARRRSTGASAPTSAHPWPQNAKGHLLGDVTDQGRSIDDPTAPRQRDRRRRLPVPLRRLRPRRPVLPRRGRERRRQPRRQRGHDPQRARAHRTRARGRAVRAVPLRPPRRAGARARKPWYTMPIFSRCGDRLFVRYIRPYIESARRHEDAPRPSDAAPRGDGPRRRDVRRPRVPRVDDACSPATCSS